MPKEENQCILTLVYDRGRPKIGSHRVGQNRQPFRELWCLSPRLGWVLQEAANKGPIVRWVTTFAILGPQIQLFCRRKTH